MGMYDKSGVGFYEPPVGSALADGGGGIGSMLTGVGGMMAGGLPLALGVGAVGGMFGDQGKMDVSKAVSGGTFMSGDFTVGKSETTLIIIVVVVLGLLIFFKGKK